MADIQNIRQPNNEHLTGKQKVPDPADKDKFQREMYKVDATDPENQSRKKKQTAEDEEETPNPLTQEPTAPTGNFTQSQGPLDVQGGSRSSSLSSSSSSSPVNAFTPSGPLDADVEEEDFDVDDAQTFTFSSEQTYAQPLSQQETYQTPSSETTPPETQTPSTEQTPEAQKKAETTQAKEAKKSLPPTLPGTDLPLITEKEKADLDGLGLEGLKQAPMEIVPTTGGAKDLSEKNLKVGEKISLSGLSGKPTTDDEDKELAALLNPGTQVKTETELTGKPPPLSPTPYSNLSAHLLELFEKMVGVITVMQLTGKTETTLTLGAGSRFAGTKISIETFAHAPGSFNIRLEGTPESTAVFNACSKDLMAAFQYGNYNFRVHRLDVSLLRADHDIVHRKENASGEQDEQPG